MPNKVRPFTQKQLKLNQTNKSNALSNFEILKPGNQALSKNSDAIHENYIRILNLHKKFDLILDQWSQILEKFNSLDLSNKKFAEHEIRISALENTVRTKGL